MHVVFIVFLEYLFSDFTSFSTLNYDLIIRICLTVKCVKTSFYFKHTGDNHETAVSLRKYLIYFLSSSAAAHF